MQTITITRDGTACLNPRSAALIALTQSKRVSLAMPDFTPPAHVIDAVHGEAQ